MLTSKPVLTLTSKPVLILTLVEVLGYSCAMMFMPVASFDIQWPIMFFVRKVSTHLYTILAPWITFVAKNLICSLGHFDVM